MTYNQQTRTLKLPRIALCDLLLATTILAENTDGTKWEKLHDEIRRQLDEQDEKRPPV